MLQSINPRRDSRKPKMFSNTLLKLVLFTFFSALLIGSTNAKRSSDDRGDDAVSAQCTTNTGIPGVQVLYAARTKHVIVKGKVFPTLIDVTTEDLAYGLETGLFTSVDLATVRPPQAYRRIGISLSCFRPTSTASTRSTRPCTWSKRSTQMF